MSIPDLPRSSPVPPTEDSSQMGNPEGDTIELKHEQLRTELCNVNTEMTLSQEDYEELITYLQSKYSIQ